MRDWGMTFPGNGVADVAIPAALKTRVRGSKMLRPEAEKSPLRMALVATEELTCVVSRSRSSSRLDMKKSLSLPLKILGIEIGPPRVKPYWLRRKGFLEPCD